MSIWETTPPGTTDEGFQVYEATKGLANVTFFNLLICFFIMEQGLLFHSKWERSILTSYVEKILIFSDNLSFVHIPG